METISIFHVNEDTVGQLLSTALAEQCNSAWGMSTFNGLPTAMLFRPNSEMEGSFHYMFFPSSAQQRFHYHPGSRYLVLLGDVDIHVHYSNVGKEECPYNDMNCIILPKHTLCVVRFKPYLWHRFETKDERGTGVMAFSFHGDDQLEDTENITDDLMEELTTFWEKE